MQKYDVCPAPYCSKLVGQSEAGPSKDGSEIGGVAMVISMKKSSMIDSREVSRCRREQGLGDGTRCWVSSKEVGCGEPLVVSGKGLQGAYAINVSQCLSSTIVCANRLNRQTGQADFGEGPNGAAIRVGGTT